MSAIELAILLLRIATRVLRERIALSEEELRTLRLSDFLPGETFEEILARKRAERKEERR